MQNAVLTNSEIFPTEEILSKYLGGSFAMYKRILDYTHEQIPGVEDIWTYYKDGSNWLLRLIKKSKTYFWITVFDGSFRITFYLNTAAEKKVVASNIPDALKEEYALTKDRQVRWISLVVNNKEDFEVFKTMLQIKGNLK